MVCHNFEAEAVGTIFVLPSVWKKLDNAVPSFRILLSFENVTEKQAIEAYFNSGFSYNVFLCFLRKYDGIQISL